MNLFSNILNPQASQAFSQAGSAIGQAFKPLTQFGQQVSQPIQQVGTGIGQGINQVGQGIYQPIKKEFDYQRKVTKAIEPYKQQIKSLGLTAQSLDEMGFSEEEKQAIKDIYSELGETLPGLEEQQAVQAQQGPDLGFFGSIKEGIVGGVRTGEQLPRYAGNLLDLTQKYVTTPLIAGGLEAIGAEEAGQAWRQAGTKFGAGAKGLGEEITRAGEGNITEKQRAARRFGASMVATAPIPLGTASKVLQGAGLGKTIARGAMAGAVGTPIYTGLEEGRLPTGGEMATGTAGGAILGPVAEKIVLPTLVGVASKTGKYGTALVKGGTEGLKKSVSRDLSGIPKAIQGKAEAISTRANRFNALDEEKFTKQIGETPGQFAVSRGMTDVGDDAIVKANQNYQKSLQEADKSIGAIEGKFSTKGQKDDILGELVSANKAKMDLQPRNPDANKARQLFNKYESGEGLTMAEINEAKRIYQRNHTYTYDQLASNEARNSKYLQDGVREWQFKTAKENGLTNIADINKTTKAWKMWADSLAKKINRSQANNEFGITDWIALSGGTPENIALFLGKKALSSKYIKSGIIKTLGKQTKPSIIEGTNVGVQQANFLKNVNRGISNNRGDVGGKSMVKPAGLLPAPSGKATGARNVRVNQPMEKTPIVNEGQKGARPVTPKAKEAQKLLPEPRIPAGTSLPRTDIVAESMRGVNAKRPSSQVTTKTLKKEVVKPVEKKAETNKVNEIDELSKKTQKYNTWDEFYEKEIKKYDSYAPEFRNPIMEEWRNTTLKKLQEGAQDKGLIFSTNPLTIESNLNSNKILLREFTESQLKDMSVKDKLIKLLGKDYADLYEKEAFKNPYQRIQEFFEQNKSTSKPSQPPLTLSTKGTMERKIIEDSQQWADRLTFKNGERKYDYYTLVKAHDDVLKKGKESGYYKNADAYIRSEMDKLIKTGVK